MYKVGFPSPNKLTQGYSASHTGYDIDAEPDTNIYCPLNDAKVVLSKNSETRQWIANSKTDPYKNDSRRPNLITEDYGNYVKLKGKDNAGLECYCLIAHLQPGSAPKVGSTFKQGEVVGKAGFTGNTTGTHSHSEFRDLKEVKQPVQFEAATPQPQPTNPDLDDQQRAITIFKNYRQARTQGPEGSWEGYANVLTGHDRDFARLETDLANEKKKTKALEASVAEGISQREVLDKALGKTREDLIACEKELVKKEEGIPDPKQEVKRFASAVLFEELLHRLKEPFKQFIKEVKGNGK